MFLGLRKVAVVCFALCIFVQIAVLPVLAASTWTQTNWVGGDGQTAWADDTKFSSASNVKVSTAGQIELASTAPADWYDELWLYRKEVTIDPSAISGTDPLSNFPFLVTIDTDADLASDAQDGAQDLRFTGSDGITPLSFEVESFDGATGTLRAWVSVPSVSATVSTSVYLYYGNSDTNLTAGNTPENIWTNYGMVLHLDQESGQFLDSTSNSNDTTTAVVDARSVAGQINGAIRTTNATGQLIVPHNVNGSLDLNSDFTLSFWVKPITGGGAFQQVIQKTVDGGNPNNMGIYINNNDVFVSYYTDGFKQYQAFSVLDYDQWNYVTYRRTGSFGSGNLFQSIYVNGVLERSDQVLSANEVFVTNTSDLLIARQPSGNPLNGELDEVRISTSPFTSEYIIAEYQNQQSPGTFFTLGAEEPQTRIYQSSGTLTSSIFDTVQASDWGTITANVTTPASTSVVLKARSGNDPSLADAPAFGSCDALTLSSDISSNSCITDGNRYVQYQVTLSTSDTSVTPQVLEIGLSYDATPPSPSPQAAAQSSSYGPTSPPTVPTCQSTTPVGLPDLFQINRGETTATLYFTPVNDNLKAYHVIYGFSAGDQRFGSLSEQVSADSNNGVQKITIRDLDPHVQYWFQIAAVNDCAVGSWSNWMKADKFQGSNGIFYRYFSQLK